MVVNLGHQKKIKAGFIPIIDCHTGHTACKFKEILSILDIKTKAVIKEKPEFIQNKDYARVELIPQKPMVVETLSKFAPLARFVVRE